MCFVPSYCDSFPSHDTSAIFGRTLLKCIFRHLKNEVLDKFHQERESIDQSRRGVILSNFPAFLNILESELVSPNSPIWDEEFKSSNPLYQPLFEASRVKNNAARKGGEFERVTLSTGDREGFTVTTMTVGGGKGKGADTPGREARRRKVQEDQFEDLPSETVAKIMATIDDPNYMTGPDVNFVFYLF